MTRERIRRASLALAVGAGLGAMTAAALRSSVESGPGVGAPRSTSFQTDKDAIPEFAPEGMMALRLRLSRAEAALKLLEGVEDFGAFQSHPLGPDRFEETLAGVLGEVPAGMATIDCEYFPCLVEFSSPVEPGLDSELVTREAWLAMNRLRELDLGQGVYFQGASPNQPDAYLLVYPREIWLTRGHDVNRLLTRRLRRYRRERAVP